jgi:hypothetical protein
MGPGAVTVPNVRGETSRAGIGDGQKVLTLTFRKLHNHLKRKGQRIKGAEGQWERALPGGRAFSEFLEQVQDQDNPRRR